MGDPVAHRPLAATRHSDAVCLPTVGLLVTALAKALAAVPKAAGQQRAGAVAVDRITNDTSRGNHPAHWVWFSAGFESSRS